MIAARMALPKDARHDFYKLASKQEEHETGLVTKELWAEAVFFIAAGKYLCFLLGGFFFHFISKLG